MTNLLWISLVEPAFTSQVQFLQWCLCVFAGFQCRHWEVLMQPASSSPSCRTWWAHQSCQKQDRKAKVNHNMKPGTQVDLTDQARPMTPELPALNSLIVLESDASWTACWSTNPGLRHSWDTSGNMWQRFKAQSGMVSPGFNSSRRCFLDTSHHLTSFDIASIRKKHERNQKSSQTHKPRWDAVTGCSVRSAPVWQQLVSSRLASSSFRFSIATQ